MKHTSKIKTTYWPPPIPFRQFDWYAYRDGEEDLGYHGGYGRTEQEAIDDLLAIEAEDEN